MWLAADALEGAPPFVNQLVIRGDGALEPTTLEQALARAAAAWPGLAARATGVLGWSRWAPGPPPRLRVVDGVGWDGDGPDGAPWLSARLDPHEGPVAEVLLVRGCTAARLVVRTHHAVVDGRGATAFAHDLFAALRGEPPRGEVPAPSRDVDLCARLPTGDDGAGGRCGGPPPPHESEGVPALLGPATHPVTWARVRHEGHCAGLLPRVLVALRDAASGPLRVSVPADLRPADMARACANLTGLARVDVPPDSDAAAARASVAAALPRAGAAVTTAHGLRWLPLWALAAGARAGARRLATSGISDASATVSNLGRADLAALSGGGFTATGTFWIPPGSPGNPAFLSLAGDATGADVCLAAPVARERILALLARIRAHLAT